MCYSALIEANYRKYVREFGAQVSLEDFTEQAMADPGKGKRPKWPKGMRDAAAIDPAPEAASQFRRGIDLGNGSSTHALAVTLAVTVGASFRYCLVAQ